jgi:casein kinase 1
MQSLLTTRYRLYRRIGSGSFGEIYSAEDVLSHRQVALKLESAHCKSPQLAYESKLYRIFAGGTGIPRLYWFGADEKHSAMAIDLLGMSTEDLFSHCHCHFSLKTVLMLADQMLNCVEYLHAKSFIHRDIKPANFVMGLDSQANQVFIIDFGLAKRYQDPETYNHIPYIEGKAFTGTARYGSLSALSGHEQSRRDDLESLGFVWVYLLRGSLPWIGISGRDRRRKHERICEAKSRTSIEDLCGGLPSESVKYFQAVRKLEFAETPNYGGLRALFRDLFIRRQFVFDYKYDWTWEPIVKRVPKPFVEEVEIVGRDLANSKWWALSRFVADQPQKITPRREQKMPTKSTVPSWMTQSPLTRTSRLGNRIRPC